MLLARFLSKKVRIRAANPKQRVSVIIPDKRMLEPSEFRYLSQSWMSRIHEAYKGILEPNPRAKLSGSNKELSFNNDEFVVNITVDPGSQEIVLLTGEGIYRYFYDENNERWVSNVDAHLLEEMIVRETAKHCRGFFNIP